MDAEDEKRRRQRVDESGHMSVGRLRRAAAGGHEWRYEAGRGRARYATGPVAGKQKRAAAERAWGSRSPSVAERVSRYGRHATPLGRSDIRRLRGNKVVVDSVSARSPCAVFCARFAGGIPHAGRDSCSLALESACEARVGQGGCASTCVWPLNAFRILHRSEPALRLPSQRVSPVPANACHPTLLLSLSCAVHI